MARHYLIGEKEFVLFQMANGDFCVTTEGYNGKLESIKLGTELKALRFILSYAEFNGSEEE